MHELSICQALIEQVADVARAHRAARVVSVTVRIGPLCGVEPALLSSAYPLASAGTVAADSKLVLERSELTIRCLECGTHSPAEPSRLLCGACGAWRVEVLCGEDLLLASVELEKEDP